MIFLGYLFAVLPAAVIIFLAVRQLDKLSKLWIALAILFGMIVILPSFQFEKLEYLFNENNTNKGWPLLAIAFGLVGFGEELFKGVALLAVAYFSKEIINIKSGIIYAVLVAMGFALLENIFYAYRYPLSTILVRSFTAVPAHAVFAIISGYFLGLTYSSKPKAWAYFLRGLLFASLFHGAYDWFILQGYNENLIGGALFIFCLGIYYAYWLVQLGRERSIINPVESPSPSDNSLPDEKDLPDDPPAEISDEQP